MTIESKAVQYAKSYVGGLMKNNICESCHFYKRENRSCKMHFRTYEARDKNHCIAHLTSDNNK